MVISRSKVLLAALLLTASFAAPVQAGAKLEGARSVQMAAYAAMAPAATPSRTVRRSVPDVSRPRRAQAACRSIGCPNYLTLGISY